MNPNPVTFASIRRVDNGYVVNASNSARETVAVQVHASLDDAVGALAALAWAGEDTP